MMWAENFKRLVCVRVKGRASVSGLIVMWDKIASCHFSCNEMNENGVGEDGRNWRLPGYLYEMIWFYAVTWKRT